MTWLFAALWKLPASNSLTTTAEAQECVYGNVGGPKRPRSELSLSRTLECAHDGGQVVGWELTGAAGLSKDGSHGQAPHLQHRIQASGRSRIHCRRDSACAGEESRSLPQSDPHLGGQVRSGDL